MIRAESDESGDECEFDPPAGPATYGYHTSPSSTRIETSSLLDSLDVHRSMRDGDRALYRSVDISARNIEERSFLPAERAHRSLPAEEALGAMPLFKGTPAQSKPVFQMPPKVQAPQAPALPNWPLSPNGVDVEGVQYPVLLQNLTQHMTQAQPPVLDYEIDEAAGEVTGRYFSDRCINHCRFRINIYEIPTGHKLEFTRMSGSSVAFHDFMGAAKKSIGEAAEENFYGGCPPLPTFDLPALDGDRFDFDKETLDGYGNILTDAPQEAQEAILSILSQATQSNANARLISEHEQLPRLLVEHCKSTDVASARYAAVALKNITENGLQSACKDNLASVTDIVGTLLVTALQCTSQEAAFATLQAAEALLEHKVADGQPRRSNVRHCEDILARQTLKAPLRDTVGRIDAILSS